MNREQAQKNQVSLKIYIPEACLTEWVFTKNLCYWDMEFRRLLTSARSAEQVLVLKAYSSTCNFMTD